MRRTAARRGRIAGGWLVSVLGPLRWGWLAVGDLLTRAEDAPPQAARIRCQQFCGGLPVNRCSC